MIVKKGKGNILKYKNTNSWIWQFDFFGTLKKTIEHPRADCGVSWPGEKETELDEKKSNSVIAKKKNN